MKHCDVTAAQLAEALGIQRSRISHILSGRNKPSLDFVLKLLAAYPDLNLHWLVTGQAPMCRSALSDAESGNAVEGLAPEGEREAPIVEQIVIFYKDGSCKRYFPTFEGK